MNKNYNVKLNFYIIGKRNKRDDEWEIKNQVNQMLFKLEKLILSSPIVNDFSIEEIE